MLPKSQRLNLKQDFKWAAAGKKIETPLFKLFIRFGENTIPKVGVATSKQHFKSAVDRNKAKRICFEAISPLYDRLPNQINLVIMPKSNCLASSSEALRRELTDVKDLNINN